MIVGPLTCRGAAGVLVPPPDLLPEELLELELLDEELPELLPIRVPLAVPVLVVVPPPVKLPGLLYLMPLVKTSFHPGYREQLSLPPHAVRYIDICIDV